LNEVATVERKLGHLLGGNHLAERGVRRLQHDRGGGHFDGLLDGGRGERKINLAVLIHLQRKVLLLDFLEAWRTHLQRVDADGQKRQQIMARVVGLRVARDASPLRRGRYIGPGHRRA